MERRIINIYTKETFSGLIATLDVDFKFDVATWFKTNTDIQDVFRQGKTQTVLKIKHGGYDCHV